MVIRLKLRGKRNIPLTDKFMANAVSRTLRLTDLNSGFLKRHALITHLRVTRVHKMI